MLQAQQQSSHPGKAIRFGELSKRRTPREAKNGREIGKHTKERKGADTYGEDS
ncbi:MAG: hypothetical protein IJQ62_05235 [Clostridia bacterium]|nr:hypothetical protein [Clostridia bacterium]MBR0227734.1 hypothetical protein [Clostridia bacterium]